MTLTCGNSLASRTDVSSVDASSMTITSLSGQVCAYAERSAARKRAGLLSVGVTMLILLLKVSSGRGGDEIDHDRFRVVTPGGAGQVVIHPRYDSHGGAAIGFE